MTGDKDITNRADLERYIRVDHAGERGAIKIYEGQLLALQTIKQDQFLKKKIDCFNIHNNFHTNKIYKFTHHFPIVAPPSIGSATPLINPASLEAKNKVAAAASSRVPILWSG